MHKILASFQSDFFCSLETMLTQILPNSKYCSRYVRSMLNLIPDKLCIKTATFDRHDYKIGLLEYNLIWKNSFFLSRLPSILMPCLTLDPPEKKISKPQKSNVITKNL